LADVVNRRSYMSEDFPILSIPATCFPVHL
jgi:hypothetical protein